MHGSTTEGTTAGQLVLVVDDEEMMLAAFEAMLALAGYKVETSTDGASALAKYRPGKYALVITDFAMPGMNGVALAEAIRARSPGQPILLVSGSMDLLRQQGQSTAVFDVVLDKPFSLQQLQQAAVKALAGCKGLGADEHLAA